MTDKAITLVPRRRWFQFSLRTLFVVMTVIACWLCWNVRIVEQRRAMIKSIEARGGTVVFAGDLSQYEKPPEVPLVRQWLGDKPLSQISPPRNGSIEEDMQIRQTFPEAYVFYR